jgi:DNA-binding NtrC family response regulator
LHLTTFLTAVELMGASAAAERARRDFARARHGTDAVLVVAEPGLDAHAVARAIHEGGTRCREPFAAIDCAEPATVLEPQIFGDRAAGHGTGQGTLLLANIDELPMPLQSRLARALRDGRLNGEAPDGGAPFDARVMAAMRGNPEAAVHEGTLRRELSVRFALRLELPALRQRPADIPMLVGCLAGDAATGAGVPVPAFTREALTLLAALPWRRNFDELREVLDLLVLGAVGGSVRLEDVLERVPIEPVAAGHVGPTSLREARLTFERRYIASVLSRHRGRMDDAARSLGLQRTNLYRKVRQLGIGSSKAKAQ